MEYNFRMRNLFLLLYLITFMRKIIVPSNRERRFRPFMLGFCILLMMLLVLPAATPNYSNRSTDNSIEQWWDNTGMDMDRNHIHDALDIALEEGVFIEDGRISVLVDFDHTPTVTDVELLVERVDFHPAYRFHWIDIISGTILTERIDELLDISGVVFLSLNGPVEVMMDESVPEHHVDAVWDLGITGEGMTVAVIDTGIDPTHLGLNDFDDDPLTNDPKVIGFYDAINAPDETDGETEPYDDHGHGSHCAGISAGTGEGSDNKMYRGIAPGAALVGVKVLSGGGSGSFDQVMAGMEWTIDNKDKYNIKAATMSLGGVWLIELTQEEEERLTTLANTMVHEGIALTIAAGNSGGYGTIGTPGAARDVITVGATEKNRNSAIYSSRGPTAEGLIKPNLAAIGSNVMSVQANSGNGYTSMSGTSMATPMVAGIMCLMLEANPDLDPLTLRTLLEYTSEFRFVTHPIRPNNDYGWGFVEADAALAEAVEIDPNLNITIDPETPTRTYVGNETEGNRTVYLARQDDNLYFIIDGDATALEWRLVNGSGWHTIEQSNDTMMGFPITIFDFPVGNHSLWVRAKGPNGVSAPFYIQIVVEEALPPDEKPEDEKPIVFYILSIVVGVGIILMYTRYHNKKKS